MRRNAGTFAHPRPRPIGGHHGPDLKHHASLRERQQAQHEYPEADLDEPPQSPAPRRAFGAAGDFAIAVPVTV